MVDEKKPKRVRTKKPKLCDHGYPAIPDPRGCAACWKKHPGYVKPKPKALKPKEDIRQATCEKCFLPSQSGTPPLMRISEASDVPKYAHRVCPSAATAAAGLPRRQKRALRRGLASSLCSHMGKMRCIKRARRERAVVLNIQMARAKRLLATKEKATHGRSKARAS